MTGGALLKCLHLQYTSFWGVCAELWICSAVLLTNAVIRSIMNNEWVSADSESDSTNGSLISPSDRTVNRAAGPDGPCVERCLRSLKTRVRLPSNSSRWAASTSLMAWWALHDAVQSRRVKPITFQKLPRLLKKDKHK